MTGRYLLCPDFVKGTAGGEMGKNCVLQGPLIYFTLDKFNSYETCEKRKDEN